MAELTRVQVEQNLDLSFCLGGILAPFHLSIKAAAFWPLDHHVTLTSQWIPFVPTSSRKRQKRNRL